MIGWSYSPIDGPSKSQKVNWVGWIFSSKNRLSVRSSCCIMLYLATQHLGPWPSTRCHVRIIKRWSWIWCSGRKTMDLTMKTSCLHLVRCSYDWNNLLVKIMTHPWLHPSLILNESLNLNMFRNWLFQMVSWHGFDKPSLRSFHAFPHCKQMKWVAQLCPRIRSWFWTAQYHAVTCIYFTIF